jgi:hypothetical protein
VTTIAAATNMLDKFLTEVNLGIGILSEKERFFGRDVTIMFVESMSLSSWFVGVKT